MSKPEYQGAPEDFYDETEARKYTTNSRIQTIQCELAQRAYELLELSSPPSPDGMATYPPRPHARHLLLDVGCGSGLSGQVLARAGHQWVGVDISRSMLRIAAEEEGAEEEDESISSSSAAPASGSLLLLDMGHGLPFRPGVFSGAISVSAVQWLCHSNSRQQDPRKRLFRFFESLFICLSRSARAVLQFYPDSQQQCDLITQQALRAGFQGGLVVDHPDSPKHRKVFLVLSAGKAAAIPAVTFQPQKQKQMKGHQDEGEKEEGEGGHVQNVGRERPWKRRKFGKEDKSDGKRERRQLKVTAIRQKRKERRQRERGKKREAEENGEGDGEQQQMEP